MGRQVNDGKTTGVLLSCGDTAYFYLPPEPGDFLVCGTCKQDVQVEPVEASFATVIIDDYEATPVGRGRYRGKCLIEKCGYEARTARGKSAFSWWGLKNAMATHQVRDHSRFGSTLKITVVEYPPGSPPPF